MHPRSLLPPLAVLAGTLLWAAPASAAELRLDGTTVVLAAAPGERNSVSVRPDDWSGTMVQFSDVAPLTVGAGLDCELSTAGGWNFAACALPGVNAIRVETGDADDKVRLGSFLPFTGAVTVDGGAGNDDLEGPGDDRAVTLLGGDGDDLVAGGYGADVLRGGGGNDRMDGGRGDDQVLGDDGDDTLAGGQQISSDVLDGGAGNDTIDADWYDNNAPTNNVTVTLDGVADDGRPGERDNVVNVETIKTRQAARLVAAGYAVVFDVTGTGAGTTTLIGSPGADRLRSFDYDDTIQAGAGDDSIEAGNGHDTIDPGPGRDSVIADAGPNSCNFIECRGVYGNDVINARDGEQDTIDCGPGNDSVVADAADVLTGCEQIQLPSGTAPGGTPPGGSGKPQPKPKACTVPKVRSGATTTSTRKALKKARCRTATKVRKVRSKRVRKGRVVSLTVRSGKRNVTVKKGRRTSAVVTIQVSRGRR
ncbi:calcium-binding protein [Patulibacter sp. NPDC049589]|uniref:calcium-binding protein n=1 Tax=Patulibacter sp. NPDC049589 TaxID=3154731 RepID=UPI003414F727